MSACGVLFGAQRTSYTFAMLWTSGTRIIAYRSLLSFSGLGMDTPSAQALSHKLYYYLRKLDSPVGVHPIEGL